MTNITVYMMQYSTLYRNFLLNVQYESNTPIMPARTRFTTNYYTGNAFKLIIGNAVNKYNTTHKDYVRMLNFLNYISGTRDENMDKNEYRLINVEVLKSRTNSNNLLYFLNKDMIEYSGSPNYIITKSAESILYKVNES